MSNAKKIVSTYRGAPFCSRRDPESCDFAGEGSGKSLESKSSICDFAGKGSGKSSESRSRICDFVGEGSGKGLEPKSGIRDFNGEVSAKSLEPKSEICAFVMLTLTEFRGAWNDTL